MGLFGLGTTGTGSCGCGDCRSGDRDYTTVPQFISGLDHGTRPDGDGACPIGSVRYGDRTGDRRHDGRRPGTDRRTGATPPTTQ
ncbi:hypothetical protein XF36_12715 [Pseudonocardia sp. HH130629-09]|nr:hypothetical protein XF36_12715 [Pseudonocardia sp. HH130629-09]